MVHVISCTYFQVKLNYVEKNYIALSESCVQIDKLHMLEIRYKMNFLWPFILFSYTTESAGWYSRFQARVVGSSPLQRTDFPC